MGAAEFPYIQHPDAFFLARIHRFYVFVAEINGEFAGFVDIEPFPSEDEYTALLAGIAVQREFRGRGIGSDLMRFALRFAKAVGFRRIIIFSKKDNIPAKKLYERFGFRVEKEHRGILKWVRRLDAEAF